MNNQKETSFDNPCNPKYITKLSDMIFAVKISYLNELLQDRAVNFSYLALADVIEHDDVYEMISNFPW